MRAIADLSTTFARARAHGLSALDEPTGKALLVDFGIAVPASRVVGIDEDMQQAIVGLAPPFVLKVVAPGVLHKSDVGGVRVGLNDAKELAVAAATMGSHLRANGIAPSGWLVEQMVPRGIEIVIGGVRDPEFGPMIMVGLGGIFVEVMKDVSFRICPISAVDAQEMLEELRGAPLLRGIRGSDAVAVDAIVHTLVLIGGEDGLFLRCAEDIAEIDINPLIVTRDAAVAADARVVLRVD